MANSSQRGKWMSDSLVLLVEDEPSDVRLLQRAFAKLGIDLKLLRLSSGDDAVAYLAGDYPYENRAAYPIPSVMLLDLKLPGRSGFEVLQWVRAQEPPINRLPIVVLTSSNRPNDIKRAYESGANSYLVKPDAPAQIEELVSRFHSYWVRLNEGPNLQS
jgi:CheY-like chemotaxis protein